MVSFITAQCMFCVQYNYGTRLASTPHGVHKFFEHAMLIQLTKTKGHFSKDLKL